MPNYRQYVFILFQIKTIQHFLEKIKILTNCFIGFFFLICAMNFDFRGNLFQNFSSQKALFLHLVSRIEGIIKETALRIFPIHHKK